MMEAAALVAPEKMPETAREPRMAYSDWPAQAEIMQMPRMAQGPAMFQSVSLNKDFINTLSLQDGIAAKRLPGLNPSPCPRNGLATKAPVLPNKIYNNSVSANP